MLTRMTDLPQKVQPIHFLKFLPFSNNVQRFPVSFARIAAQILKKYLPGSTLQHIKIYSSILYIKTLPRIKNVLIVIYQLRVLLDFMFWAPIGYDALSDGIVYFPHPQSPPKPNSQWASSTPTKPTIQRMQNSTSLSPRARKGALRKSLSS